MNQKKLQDDVFEAILRRAVIDRFDERMAAMPSDDELKNMYILSETHEARMRRLFAKDRRRDAVKHIVKVGKRAAVIIALVATLLFGALLSVPEVRAAVKDTIIIWFDKFTMFISGNDETAETEPGFGVWEPGYIPSGFFETFRNAPDVVAFLEYRNESGCVLTLFYTEAVGSASVNNEDAIYSPEPINGIDYYIFEASSSEDKSNIVWDMGGVRFTLSAQMEIGELKKIAMSVEKAK